MLSATADAARLRDPAALPRLLLTLLTLALLFGITSGILARSMLKGFDNA